MGSVCLGFDTLLGHAISQNLTCCPEYAILRYNLIEG